MHTRQVGRHRSGIRSTTRNHTARHANTMAGRFHLDWTWSGVWAWAVAFAAATRHKSRHSGPIYQATRLISILRFTERASIWAAMASRIDPVNATVSAPSAAFVLQPTWNTPTRASIAATPWGQS